MEKEVSHAIEIGVSLIAVSAVIAIIWFTVFLGQDLKISAVNESSRIVTDLQEGVISDMVGQQNDIPTATAYGIVRSYGSIIPSSTCKICGKVTDLTKDTPCLLNHMHGELSVEVNAVNSWYEITIHKLDCTWYYNNCNCNALP